MQLHFCRVAVFIAIHLQVYSAFGDDIQGDFSHSMVVRFTLFAKRVYYLREENALSSRGEYILFASRKTFVRFVF